jgi:myo-inositol-1(or 4)-monophosphatase
MSPGHGAVLSDMTAVAAEAGALTLRHVRRLRDLAVEVKGPGDFVSDADREAERLIRARLLARYPGWSLTGEEFPPEERGGDHRWLVDPIDGTTNFLNGMPYAVSIALRRRRADGGEETVAGVVHDPVAGETFAAQRGGGAWRTVAGRGAERLRVSDRSEVGLMAVGTGLPTPNLHSHAGFYERLGRIRAPVGMVRIMGSSALSCTHVACGRLTGYFEESGLLDWGAGALIAEEAGAVVTDWWGREPAHAERSGMVVVANPATHAWLMGMLADAPRKDG